MAIFAIPLKQKALIPAHGSEHHKVRRGYIDKCIYFISLDCRNTEESIFKKVYIFFCCNIGPP